MSIFLIGNVLAESSISQTSFVIKVYNNTVSIISSEYSGNNKIDIFNFSLLSRNDTITAGNVTSNITIFYAPYTEFNYTFLFGTRNISVDIGLVDKWANCMNETTTCKLDAASNFTTLSLAMNTKDNDIQNKQTLIDTLIKEKTDTQNQKWLFAIGGAGLTVLIIFTLQGKIGKKVGDKSLGEFNPRSAG